MLKLMGGTILSLIVIIAGIVIYFVPKAWWVDPILAYGLIAWNIYLTSVIFRQNISYFMGNAGRQIDPEKLK